MKTKTKKIIGTKVWKCGGMRKLMECQNCKKIEPHCAKGLCYNCYIEIRNKRIGYCKTPTFIKWRAKYWKIWRTKNPEKVRLYYRTQAKRIGKNPKLRIDSNMRCLIWLALKGRKAGMGWQKLVGYTLRDLMTHLEQQFNKNMSWANYGSYWWVDHIKPRSLFKYKTPQDIGFKECWSLSNLQPMEKIANIKKSNKY